MPQFTLYIHCLSSFHFSFTTLLCLPWSQQISCSWFLFSALAPHSSFLCAFIQTFIFSGISICCFISSIFVIPPWLTVFSHICCFCTVLSSCLMYVPIFCPSILTFLCSSPPYLVYECAVEHFISLSFSAILFYRVHIGLWQFNVKFLNMYNEKCDNKCFKNWILFTVNI